MKCSFPISCQETLIRSGVGLQESKYSTNSPGGSQDRTHLESLLQSKTQQYRYKAVEKREPMFPARDLV